VSAPELSTLVVNGVGQVLSEQGGKALTKLTQLKFLTLTNVVDAEGTKAIAGMTKLKTLSLILPSRGSREPVELFAGWPVNTELDGLNLHGQPVSDATLRNAAKTFPNMRFLNPDVAPGSPTAAGVASLAKLPNLTMIDFMGDGVDDALAAEIGKLSNLTRLTLSKARLTDTGAAALGGLKSLKVLTIYDPPMSDAALKSYANLTSLSEFRLENGSKSTPEVKQKLRDALPKVKVQ